jgi:hypothetical protein
VLGIIFSAQLCASRHPSLRCFNPVHIPSYFNGLLMFISAPRMHHKMEQKKEKAATAKHNFSIFCYLIQETMAA